jgi:hypothetical protein
MYNQELYKVYPLPENIEVIKKRDGIGTSIKHGEKNA